jgi:hypothetical protein
MYANEWIAPRHVRIKCEIGSAKLRATPNPCPHDWRLGGGE